VVTPGTLIEDNLLEEDINNYLCSVYISEDGCGLAFADISTGELRLAEPDTCDDSAVINELGQYSPREIIFNSAFVQRPAIAKFMREKLSCTADLMDDELYEPEKIREAVLDHFKANSLEDLGMAGKEHCVFATGALLFYLKETQKVGLERLCAVTVRQECRYMRLDDGARRNLELLSTLRSKEKKGSLLWALDKTKTPMGKRLIKTWITQPLIHPPEIEKRLNAVEELFDNELLLSSLRDSLGCVFDLERLLTRIIYGNATPREFVILGGTLEKIQIIKEALGCVKSKSLTAVFEEIDMLEDVAGLISGAIVEAPGASLKDGGVIRSEHSAELEELRSIMGGAREMLTAMEASEKEATGIKNLKIGFNKVFGYYIEVTRTGLSQVPERYIRKQTVANGERYITHELKELENRVLTAEEEALRLEAELFERVRVSVAKELHRIQKTATAIARLDVLCSFARVSLDNRYVRPEITSSDIISIRDGRHPVVELTLEGLPFVPNDTLLDGGKNQANIVTGPNMAGKSTYMRQTALIVLMAQIGCFIPALAASIGVADAIYTRIGASDDLSSGQSTFMVEMVELSHILANATQKSLLILDEIGRGTSTFDGMSIARAALEYLAARKKPGARTMFATHYHELTELEDLLPRVKNYNVAVKKRGDDITFLRKIVRGGADDSYGIEVASLAGVPDSVIKRAREILRDLEGARPVRMKEPQKNREPAEDFQIAMEPGPSELEIRLARLDINTLTPIEALTTLFELKGLLDR
jgi:DNA mismatch repair protein MutS